MKKRKCDSITHGMELCEEHGCLKDTVVAAARAWVEKRNHACEWAVIRAVDALVEFEEETE